MTQSLDNTHDPAAESWVTSANARDTAFPIQNLPFGRFRHAQWNGQPRVGVAIGDNVLDVCATAAAVSFSGLARIAADACIGGNLNALVALPADHATALRHAIFNALNAATGKNGRAPETALVPMDEAQLLLPVTIGDYTDFFCSMHHAVNASRIFKRPEPLRPNYHYLPVGYHGRASSVVVSGTDVRRPRGELPPQAGGVPVYKPSELLDYEVELGIIARGGNALGENVSIDKADDAIFGVCLMNDWSARDIQRWENLPLGPFLAKSFATSISPWIVTTDALRPFVCAMQERPEGIPSPPPHLNPAPGANTTWLIDIECAIETDALRASGNAPAHISTSHLTDMHWSAKHMVTHHTSNGCNLRAGDLLGTGTISGPLEESWGCLLERTHDGATPVAVGTEKRAYLEDGDRVVMTGRCAAPGAHTIGLGICEGQILPAV